MVGNSCAVHSLCSDPLQHPPRPSLVFFSQVHDNNNYYFHFSTKQQHMQLRSHPQEDYHRSIIHIDQVQVQQTPFYKPPCSHTHIKPMLLVTTYYKQARETQILDRPKHNTCFLYLSTNCCKIMCRVMRCLLYS